MEMEVRRRGRVVGKVEGRKERKIGRRDLKKRDLRKRRREKG